MLKKAVRVLTGLLLICLCWELASRLVSRPFLPQPYQVFILLPELCRQGIFPADFLISAARVFVSMTFSFLLAVPLGLVIGRNALLEAIFSPVLYLLYPLPKIVFLPLLILLLGLGNLPKILLISLVVFFQILVSVRDAAQQLPAEWLLSVRSLHASSWQVFRHVIWPYCLPAVFTALRVSLGTAIAVLYTAETFASTDGLGVFILDSLERREYGSMYAGIMAMGLLGLAFYTLLDLIERICCPWKKA